MKDFIKYFTFTKKSIFTVSLITLSVLIYIAIKIGFENKADIILSCIFLSLVFVIYILYVILVLCSYYKLPKNKTKNSIGVVFFIDTHDNVEDYKSLNIKIVEQFETLTKNALQKDIHITPVLLSLKQVSSYKKHIEDENVQVALIEKCNCIFGIFIKSYDEGRKGGNIYQLQMNARILHPNLEPEIHNILKKNFSYIFQDLKLNRLDRNNDLNNLQNFGSKLFYICHLIFAVANSYCGHIKYAFNLYYDMLKITTISMDKFYVNLSRILHFELCGCAILLCIEQYNNFALNGVYDFTFMDDVQKKFYTSIKILKIDQFIISYHLQKAIYYSLCENRLNEAKGEISLLEKRYKRIKPNLRPWAFSNAFLFACGAKKSELHLIKDYYKNLRYNIAQEPAKILAFITSYLDNKQANINIKLAFFWLVFFRDDLSNDLLSKDFLEEIKSDLKLMDEFTTLNEIDKAIDTMQ